MKRWILTALAGGAALLAVGGLGIARGWAGQPPQAGHTILATAFDKDTNGWITIGEKAKVSVENDTVTGTNSLRYDYSVAKGNVNPLILPVNENELAQAKAFRFSIKTDYPTTVVVSLQETEAQKEEGRYVAFFHSPGDTWQEVSLAPSDFILSQNENDPKDPDSKLDLEKVHGIAMLDLMQVIAQAGDGPVADLLGVKKGEHKTWVKDFRVTTESLPGASFLTASDNRLDTFGHPQVGWLGIGGVKMALHSGAPIDSKGLKVTYTVAQGKIAGFARTLPVGRLAGKKTLQMTMVATKPSTLIVQVEEKSGGKYNANVDLDANKPKEVNLSFADFTASDDSKDDNNKLDVADIKQVLIIDISGALASAPDAGEKSVYLTGFRAL